MNFKTKRLTSAHVCNFASAACLTTLCVASIVFQSDVYAQSSGGSEGGLQLGEPSAPASQTLDLGAEAPADRPIEGTTPPAAPPEGADVTRETIGAWELACPPEGVNCAMAQIGNDESGTPVLEMVVRKLPEPMEVGESIAIAVLDVITPLGVVLTEGLAVTIDGGPEETAPFQICTEQGCLVREPVDNDLIARFKRGNSAEVAVTAANQGEVTATLSLSGFTNAYDQLK